MFLIDAIQQLEKKFKTCFIYLRNCLGEMSHSVQNKTSFDSFRVLFSGGKKIFIQNRQEKYIISQV